MPSGLVGVPTAGTDAVDPGQTGDGENLEMTVHGSVRPVFRNRRGEELGNRQVGAGVVLAPC